MKKQIILFITIGILNLIFFLIVFHLFQNDTFYRNSLGLISENYYRTGGWENFEIKKIAMPFLEINNEKFNTWDAAIYKCISERMYLPENNCFGTVRATFFPLFPLLWKLSNTTAIGISIINYLLYFISLSILISLLLKTSSVNQWILYALLITLPSSIIFYIPYTESLFMATMTIACIGILHKKYWIFFMACFLLALVRPATIFVLIAILLSEFIIYLNDKSIRKFLKEILLKSSPFILAYAFTLYIQFVYTGSWISFILAQKNWTGGIQMIKSISDWSIEGFGLSLFALFFVCIPSFLFLIYLIIQKLKSRQILFIQNIKNYNSDYLFMVSIFYIVGILLFTLLSSGGNLHSFFRFTLASPFFYISVLYFLNFLFSSPLKIIFIRYFLIMFGLLILFLSFVEYGGQRLQFSFFGLYLFILTGFFLIKMETVSPRLKLTVAIPLMIMNTIWNAYLLNMFFSNAWIFT